MPETTTTTTTSAANVTASKPAAAGCAFIAPTTATLPTSASGTLATDFKGLGYLSEDGLTNSHTPANENIKAFGGDIVLSAQTERPDQFTFTLIEALNENVLKAVYGSANVTSSSGAISVSANAGDLGNNAYVFDVIVKGGRAKRIVVPSAKITSVGEIVYKDSAAVGYNVTITANPDASGNTHYEYIAAAT